MGSGVWGHTFWKRSQAFLDLSLYPWEIPAETKWANWAIPEKIQTEGLEDIIFWKKTHSTYRNSNEALFLEIPQNCVGKHQQKTFCHT